MYSIFVKLKNVNFDLLVGYSEYFYKNRKLYEEKQDIELLEEPIEINDDAFYNFIKSCQDEDCELTISNIFAIRQLANHYEVHKLENEIDKCISDNPDLLELSCLSNLLTNKDPKQIQKDERMISDNFFKIINNEKLMKLSIPVLYRILNNYSININKLQETEQKQIEWGKQRNAN